MRIYVELSKSAKKEGAGAAKADRPAGALDAAEPCSAAGADATMAGTEDERSRAVVGSPGPGGPAASHQEMATAADRQGTGNASGDAAQLGHSASGAAQPASRSEEGDRDAAGSSRAAEPASTADADAVMADAAEAVAAGGAAREQSSVLEEGAKICSMDVEAKADEGAAAAERGWVPLVHAPANTERPAVLIRPPLRQVQPPTAQAAGWRVGERVEVCNFEVAQTFGFSFLLMQAPAGCMA